MYGEQNQDDSEVFDQESGSDQDAQSQSAPVQVPRRINEVIIVGNVFTPTAAIMNYIPYHVGEIFDPQKSSMLIRNLYNGLKRFRNIVLKGEFVDDDLMNLYVVVEEKTPLKDVRFVGNDNMPEKEIFKKVDMDVPALDPEELKVFGEQIKKLYYDKGFQNVAINTELVVDADGRSVATFKIDEGQKSRIRRITFEGNHHFNAKELRDVLLTKEEWILSVMDKTGSFHPERLQADKHVLEQHYQNHGFMQAKVVDVKIEKEPVVRKPVTGPIPKHPRRRARKKMESPTESNILHLTFVIQEGDRYKFGKVNAPGQENVSEQFLLANIPVRPGIYYSRERIANTIKMMEFLWGNLGYIFANIEPSVQVDQETKTVDISFNSDIGNKIKLNRINIKGNRKTRDKVIRRRISLSEGQSLTQGQMEASKNSVMNLGYFDKQDGVNWKIKRKNDQEADLDLMVREAKTGNANVQLGFGGAGANEKRGIINDIISGVNVKGTLSDTNLFGTGTVVNLEGSWAKGEQTLNFHLAQPWLFDKPISGAMDIYHRRPTFDQLRNVTGAINSKITGASLLAGFITPPTWAILNNTSFLLSLGGESIQYFKGVPVDGAGNVVATVSIRSAELPKGVSLVQAEQDYGKILLREFKPGEYIWVSAIIDQDKRNHPMHTSRGQKLKIISKVAIPSLQTQPSTIILNNVLFANPENPSKPFRGFLTDPSPENPNGFKIGYAKLFMDYTWYTPLINEQDLVFKLHLFFGLATPLKGRSIPFNELFHIGGDNSVRGFTYGEIGPKFLGDTIGGKKAFFMNSELVFPITSDLSMKGVMFYDGGSGWDNPYACDASQAGLITNNGFDYRHAVGFGLRLLRPMPVRIDWGFKLDPRKGEQESQVHFSMSYDW